MSEELRNSINDLHYNKWFIPSENYEPILSNQMSIKSAQAIYLGKTLTRKLDYKYTFLYDGRLTFFYS